MAVVIVLIAGGIALWLWQGKNIAFFSKNAEPAAFDPKNTLGGRIFEQTQNPLKGRLPSTNPYEEAKTNPLGDVYQNPF